MQYVALGFIRSTCVFCLVLQAWLADYCSEDFVGPNIACFFTADKKKNVTNSWLVAETQSVWHAVQIK